MIKFNEPSISTNLKKIKNLDHFSSNGKFTKKCENWLLKKVKCKDALLVQSCTAALEICALLLNIKKNDEIIMPSYTFVSTANAFVMRGGTPVFVDVERDSCNIDPTKVEQAITSKTKAIVVVHYAGISCEMSSIIKIARKHNLYVIEDAAQAILSSYRGRPLGSIGDLATISFHETKNIQCGEGGALLINNSKFINRAKIIRDKGTNRDLFNRNMVKKYTWIDYGSSYGLSEINAFFLYEQLKKAKKYTSKRIRSFNQYKKFLYHLVLNGDIKLPNVPKYAKNNGHIFYIVTQKKNRDSLIKHLKNKKIPALFHYIPLHSSKFGKKKSRLGSKMINTNILNHNLLRLPMHIDLKLEDILKVCKEIDIFYKK